MTASVVVVGGGITGVTAAYRLARAGRRVTLVVADDRLGGKIRSRHRDGFVLEGGPDSLLTLKPAALALAEEVGLGESIVPAAGGDLGVYVLRDGRLRALPEGMTGLLPRRIGPLVRSDLLSPAGKCRMALEALVPTRAGDTDESLGDFVTRRLGREATTRLAEPLVGGIFATDPARLSLLATMPHLRRAEVEHGSLLRAMLAQRRGARRTSAAPAGGAAPATVTFSGGLETLVRAVADHLGDTRVELSTSVRSVERQPDGRFLLRVRRRDGRDDVLTADAVVLAVPSAAAAGMLEDLSAELATAVRTTAHTTSTVAVALGYRAQGVADRLPGTGYLVPASEGRVARACTWTSVRFPAHAPPAHALVRVSLGGVGRPALDGRSEQELVGLARRELADTVGIESAPVVTAVSRHLKVMPVYPVGHPGRLAVVDRHLRSAPGLLVAGSGFHGLSVPDCVASAERAVDATLAHLSGR